MGCGSGAGAPAGTGARPTGGLGLGGGVGAGVGGAACSVAAGARVPPLRPAFSRLAVEKKRHNSVLSPRVMSFGAVEDTAPVPLTRTLVAAGVPSPRTLGGSGSGSGSSSSNSLCTPRGLGGSETPRESPAGAAASPSATEVPSSASRVALVSSPQSRFLTVVSHPPRPGASPPASGPVSPAVAPRTATATARTPSALLPGAALAPVVAPVSAASAASPGTGLSAPSSPLRSPRRGGIPRLPTELLPAPGGSAPRPALPGASPARGRTPASPGMGLLQSPQCSPLLDRHLAPPPAALARAESPCFSPITAAADSPRTDSPRAAPLLATRPSPAPYGTLV